MVRALRLLAVSFLALLAAVACGRKGGDDIGVGVSELDVRTRVEQMLIWAAAGDLESARPHLALAEFSGLLTQGRPKPVTQMTPDERASLEKACFNQLVGVTQASNLRDQTSIRAALAAGKVSIAAKIRHADVSFTATRADGKGAPLRYRANLALYDDGGWHLISCEEQFR